jgi:hypothetical protein
MILGSKCKHRELQSCPSSMLRNKRILRNQHMLRRLICTVTYMVVGVLCSSEGVGVTPMV